MIMGIHFCINIKYIKSAVSYFSMFFLVFCSFLGGVVSHSLTCAKMNISTDE